MGLVTDWINAKNRFTAFTRSSLAGSFGVVCKGGEGDTYLVPLYRLEILAARHRTHSREILQKRARHNAARHTIPPVRG
jgi:hypothetical protein